MRARWRWRDYVVDLGLAVLVLGFLAFVASLPVLGLGAIMTAARAALADDDDAPAEPEWDRTWLVHGARMTPRIALVLDVSGSMRGAIMDQAQQELVTILGLFPDDGKVRVYAFNTITSTLKSDEPDGWHQMPSALVERAIADWASGFGGEGETNLGDAVAVAIRDCREPDTSVVLISDCEAFPTILHYDAITKAQDAHPNGPLPVHVVLMRQTGGINHKFATSLATDIAKDSGGNLVMIQRKGSGGLWPH